MSHRPVRSVRRIAPLLLLSVLSSPLAARDAAPPSAPLAGFDDYVREAVEEWGVPGLAVAVVEDGETVFAGGYGVRELGRPGGVSSDTLFAIGSTTKAITAAVLGSLVDEGKLGWDDPVVEHLPWFRVEDPYLTRELTVRDLLTHRGGLANADFLWYVQEADTRELLERLRLVETAYSPRSSFLYHNVLYGVAGEVAAAVSGESWANLVRGRILEPLGMGRTVTFLSQAEALANVASPHDLVDHELTVIENASVDRMAPAGSIWSSAGDMARWIGFLLRGCVTEGGERLLEEATCEELFTPQALVPREVFYPTARLTDPHWTTYGLGWFQHDHGGRKVDFHTGSIDGMVAIVGLLRDEGVGIVVLANRDHAELRHALMYRLFDLYHPEPPRDWSAEVRELYRGLEEEAEAARQERLAARVEGTEPSLPLVRYAGTYTDPLRGRVEVTRTGDGSLRASYGRLGGALEHWHYDTFRLEWDGGWRGGSFLTFLLDAAGEPSRLELGSWTFRRVEQEGSEGE